MRWSLAWLAAFLLTAGCSRGGDARSDVEDPVPAVPATPWAQVPDPLAPWSGPIELRVAHPAEFPALLEPGDSVRVELTLHLPEGFAPSGVLHLEADGALDLVVTDSVVLQTARVASLDLLLPPGSSTLGRRELTARLVDEHGETKGSATVTIATFDRSDLRSVFRLLSSGPIGVVPDEDGWIVWQRWERAGAPLVAMVRLAPDGSHDREFGAQLLEPGTLPAAIGLARLPGGRTALSGGGTVRVFSADGTEDPAFHFEPACHTAGVWRVESTGMLVGCDERTSRVDLQGTIDRGFGDEGWIDLSSVSAVGDKLFGRPSTSDDDLQQEIDAYDRAGMFLWHRYIGKQTGPVFPIGDDLFILEFLDWGAGGGGPNAIQRLTPEGMVGERYSVSRDVERFGARFWTGRDRDGNPVLFRDIRLGDPVAYRETILPSGTREVIETTEGLAAVVLLSSSLDAVAIDE